MSEEYTQQTINQFYAGFKKLPTGYNIEKVHQLINNPYARARHKVNFQFNYLKPIIMTGTILIGLSALFLWINPLQKTEKHLSENTDLKQNQQMQINSESTNPDENQTAYSANENQLNQEINEDADNQGYDKSDSPPMHSSEKPDKKAEQITTPVAREIAQNAELETFDGNKFILDLTFDELRNLGFNITHNAVFYRNSKVFFSSAFKGVTLKYSVNDNAEKVISIPWDSDLELQKDTFPLNADFFYTWTIIEALFPSRAFKIDTLLLNLSSNKISPLYTTELNGNIRSILNKSDFEHQNDTLVPIVLRFSQLNAGKNKDLIFWFTPTSELFEKLPERYLWLKAEYDKLIEIKINNPDFDCVNYDLEKWVNDQLFPEEKINGEEFIVSLSENELEKLGCFMKENGRLVYNYKTFGRGTSTGGKPKVVNGRQTREQIYDTIFYTDYLPFFKTFENGNPLATNTSSKELNDFLIGNDKTLPLLIKYPDWKNIILWFSLSENFWKLIPEKYQSLKNEYDKILFNKSFYPDKDLVQYIKKPFEKLDINVRKLELDKEELENIGFVFGEERLSIDCVLDQSWIQYESIDFWRKLSETYRKRIDPVRTLPTYIAFKPKNERISRSKYVNKVDSLLHIANKGFLFLGITDTLGRVLHDIPITRLMNTEENLNQDLLVPIIVRQSEYFREYAEDKVFWFTPTEEFIERLPERYKTELKNELEQIRTKSGSSCNYFEVCKSTLKLENLKVYPNPAKTSATIEFEAKDDLNGSISIVSITGANLEELVSETVFTSGFNNFQVDLSGISPGIYLIYIKTKNEFKTKRLIVSQ